MATKNIVPRADGEGGLGTSSLKWKETHHVTASFGDISLIEDESNNLQLSGGPLVAASGLSGSLTHLSDGTSYLIEGTGIGIATGSSGAITISSTGGITKANLSTTLASYDSNDTLNIGDADNDTNVVIRGDLIVNGTTTTISSSNTTFQDPIIGLGITGSETFTNTGDRGIIFARGDSPSSSLPGLWWDGTQFNLAKSLTSPVSSSFGSVDSYSPIKAGAITATGNIIPSAVGTYELGTASAEWANLRLSDSGAIYFGDDGEVKLQHVADTGLKITVSGTGAGEGEPVLQINSSINQLSGPTLQLNMQKSPHVNDVMGNIEYLADNDTGGDRVYGSITTSISNVGADDIFTGDMKFNVVSSGSLHTALLISGSDLRQTGSVDIPGHNATDSGLMLGGTLVTSTAAELNLLDGGTSVGASITIADSDGFIINDGGTMKTIPASDLSTYVGGGGGGGKHGLTITKIANFTVDNFAGATEERQLYIVNSASPVTATLPDLTTHDGTYDGYEINIKRLGAGIVHVTGSSDIDNSHTFDLPSQFSNITLVATGSQYVII